MQANLRLRHQVALFMRQYLTERGFLEIETPVLILHSENDLRCPISQAEQLFVVLKQRRKDVEFVRVPDEDHELSRSGRPSHRVDRFNVILEYLGRKLSSG